MAYTWGEMIGDFRALGGTADNIMPGRGSIGRGIFPIDRDKPTRIHVPTNLLVPVDDVQFVEGRIEIKNSAAVGEREREFFERYEKAFSWGIARQECAAHVEAIMNLPRDVREDLLISEGLVGERVEEGGNPAERWFLHSRSIKLADKPPCIMPLVELVNHGVSVKGYERKDGISVEGQFTEEVLVHYALADPLDIFLTFGFASPERICFSVPLLREGQRKLLIKRHINLKSKRGSFMIPDFKVEGDQITLSAMMIGSRRGPKLSRGIFISIMREAGMPDPETEFDTILHVNRMKFFGLLAKLESVQGELGRTIRTVIRFQLEAMSHCIGSREL